MVYFVFFKYAIRHVNHISISFMHSNENWKRKKSMNACYFYMYESLPNVSSSVDCNFSANNNVL